MLKFGSKLSINFINRNACHSPKKTVGQAERSEESIFKYIGIGFFVSLQTTISHLPIPQSGMSPLEGRQSGVNIVIKEIYLEHLWVELGIRLFCRIFCSGV